MKFSWPVRARVRGSSRETVGAEVAILRAEEAPLIMNGSLKQEGCDEDKCW